MVKEHMTGRCIHSAVTSILDVYPLIMSEVLVCEGGSMYVLRHVIHLAAAGEIICCVTESCLDFYCGYVCESLTTGFCQESSPHSCILFL